MANPEFKKTILIGLGGAGQLILLNVKRLLLDTYGVVPPSIKMLALDTDSAPVTIESGLSDKIFRFEPDEYFHLAVPDPQAFIKGSEAVRKWFVEPMPVGAITNGAGAVRQNGRLALFYHMAEFLRRMDTMVTSVTDQGLPQRMGNARIELGSTTDFELSPKNAEIYVCGSLAGGTGSGTFLDVGILLRDQIPNALIHGYLMLHWVFRKKAFAHRIRGNVYAALSELDNLQSLMYGDGHFARYQMDYADRTIVVNKCPYDLCHMIDGRNERGETIDDVGGLCEVVGNALFLAMSSMSYRINSVTDNLLSHINVSSPKLWDGRYARYSSIGAGSIYYPARELHRTIAAENAVSLCQRALDEALAVDPQAQERRRLEIAHDFDRLGESLGLRREILQNRLCPPPLITFELERGEMADTGLLQSRLDGEEKALVSGLQSSFEAQGKAFVESLQLALRQKVTDLENDPLRDSAYRQSWIDVACGFLSDLADQTIQDVNNAEQRALELRSAAGQQLGIAEKARYIPLLGGPRKSKVEDWQQTANDLLGAVGTRTRFEFERNLYAALIDQLQKGRPQAVPTEEKYRRSLGATLAVLQRKRDQEHAYFARLKMKPAQLLVGEGHVVLISSDDGLRSTDSFLLDYPQFKEAQKIIVPEDYLRVHEKNPADLIGLFATYAEARLGGIRRFGVQDVLEAVGSRSGLEEVSRRRGRGIVLGDDELAQIMQEETTRYLSEQMGHLFRVSSALWSYDRGRVTEVRSLQYDQIVNVGVPEQAKGAAVYEPIVHAERLKSHIRADHSFSSTGDPYRIWLLNYAAALPAYFLTDLQDIKKKYEEEIVPTYHIDRNLEMNVPDLFPVADEANCALRVLALAIVSGVDVIHDDYQRPKGGRGHVFGCEADSVKAMNFGLPMSWLNFRALYTDVSENAELRGLLAEELKKVVMSMDRDRLRGCITAHLETVGKRLSGRQFSRLVSARLTYREMQYLREFLSPAREGGFGMDVVGYIAGQS